MLLLSKNLSPDPLPQILDGVQLNLVGKQMMDVPVSKILVEIVELVAYRRRATARVDVHFLVPQILEQIVDVPVPQIMEETVEVAKLNPQERIQQRTLEETVNGPVLQIQQQIVAVGNAPF